MRLMCHVTCNMGTINLWLPLLTVEQAGSSRDGVTESVWPHAANVLNG